MKDSTSDNKHKDNARQPANHTTSLKELAALKNLRTLDLTFTQVTDAGLKDLAGLKSLRALDLSDTRVTRTGLKELRKALPRCEIDGN